MKSFKKVYVVMLALVLVATAVPVLAQVTVVNESGAKVGLVKKIQVKGATPTESLGVGVIDISSLVPASSSDQIWTITGSTGTASATSISVSTDTNGTKAAALKISYTGSTGTTTTGWLRVYDSAE